MAMQRDDDFESRREHLKGMSNQELHDHFWNMVDKVMQPIIENARSHTTPSIERSVLLRMGFSSMETRGIINKMLEKGILGHGAGNIVLKLAQRKNISLRDAGQGLIKDKYWEELPI